MTLATLSSAILVLDGPLLRKASYPVLAVPSGTFEFSVQMASQLPSDWSGSIRNETILDYYSPSENFQRTFLQLIQESPIQSEARNCHGSCIGKILAPGIVYGDCKRARRDANVYNLTQWPQKYLGQYLVFRSEYQRCGVDDGSWMGQDENYTTFAEKLPDYDRELLVLDTAWTNMTGGAGQVWVARCLLAAATLEYEVIVSENGTLVPVSVDDGKLYAFVNNRTAKAVSQDDGTYIYGSFSTAILEAASLIKSYYYFGQDGALNDEKAGFLAAASILNDTIDDFSSVDPLDQVMSTMNKLLFRGGALAASLPGASPESLGMDSNCLGENRECSLWQTINGTRTDEVSVYHTVYKFWGLAALTQFLAIALIAPIFWGWWRLGREVSFSPFEIAKAFDAPLLRAAHSKDKAEGIIASVGYMPVRYGVVDHDSGCACAGHKRMPVDEEQGSHHVEQCHQASTDSIVAGRLAFTDSLRVASPHNGQRFAH